MTILSIGARTAGVALVLGGAIAFGLSGTPTTAAGFDERPAGGLVIISQDGEVVHVAQYQTDRRGQFVRALARQADQDRNRTLTQAEVDTYLANRVASGDADGDGALSAAEFQAAFGALTTAPSEAFRRLDADGSGAVSAGEIDRRFGTMVVRMDRNGDGALSAADRPLR